MSETTTDYRPMWQNLGLDLEAHDALLGAIPVLYSQAYLSQTDRPEGMSYFDFVISEIHGLRIKELVDHKAAGGTVVGTFCLYVPEETHQSGGRAVRRALRRSRVGLRRGGAAAAAEHLRPHQVGHGLQAGQGLPLQRGRRPDRRRDHLRRQEEDVRAARRDGSGARHGAAADEAAQGRAPSGARRSTGWSRSSKTVTNRTLTAESLRAAIVEVNDKRRALQRLNATRKAAPVPISGKDALLAVQVAFYDDVPRFTTMVNSIADELEARVAAPNGGAARVRRRRPRRAS